jgi:hypothetical protein
MPHRDVDSSSWFLKPDHDVIMTVREKLPFKIVLLHLRSHQDEIRDYADLTRPEQLNGLTDHRATCCTQYPSRSGKPQRSTHYSPAEAIFMTPPGISPVANSARSDQYELRAYLQSRNNWSDQVYDSISWPAHRSATALLTDSYQTFVVTLSHSWLPVGAHERRCSATTDLYLQCNETETVPHLYRYQVRAPWRHRFLIQLHEHIKEIYTVADIRCIIFKGMKS